MSKLWDKVRKKINGKPDYEDDTHRAWFMDKTGLKPEEAEAALKEVHLTVDFATEMLYEQREYVLTFGGIMVVAKKNRKSGLITFFLKMQAGAEPVKSKLRTLSELEYGEYLTEMEATFGPLLVKTIKHDVSVVNKHVVEADENRNR